MINSSITVLYGSETGTAQDVAEQIWKSAKRKGLRTTVSAMDDYDIQNFTSERLIIFVVATTGQGDCPSNMKRFWTFLLRKHLSSSMLVNVHYGVLGLGDSSYQKFNFAAKKLNKRLTQLGATELVPMGLADEQHDLGIDAVVDPWMKNLWEKMTDLFQISLSDFNGADELIERFNVTVLNSGDIESIQNLECSHKNIYTAEANNENIKFGTVIKNVRTTSEDHFQDVRLIKFKSLNVKYEPGDTFNIRPRNSLKQVKKFFNILIENNVLLYPNTTIQVTEKEVKLPRVLKNRMTLQDLAEQYWDLSFKPRRSTIRVLASICEDELEKEKLCEFASSSGQDELYSYINRPRRNILEVLADFPHTTSKLNIKVLIEIMSPIKPRAYSIASSPRDTKDEIHILVAVVKYKTKLLEPRYGLCSNWLADLKDRDTVLFQIQKGTFKFVYDKPMILVGPGTGVAPFRALLLDRAALNHNLEDCILFFGCRYKEKDYHCKEDFERLLNNNHLKIFCAFSRDQDHKVYVQHIIRENNQLCWDLMQSNANIYLAGNSKNMPDSVRVEFIKLCQDVGKLTDVEAENYIKTLEKGNRYQFETWA